MYKKKHFFITFEGIEGSGKSYQSLKLYKKLLKLKIPTIYTREPGGSITAESIRKIILTGSKNKFSPLTDTLLYLASRNEHIEKTLKPASKKNKVIICDRFIDSTAAYQVAGKKINKKLVENIHSHILNGFKPDLTFILKVNMNKAFVRINKRKYKNRYDNFPKSFYRVVQNAFVNISKKNKHRCLLLDNSTDNNRIEKIILQKTLSKIKK